MPPAARPKQPRNEPSARQLGPLSEGCRKKLALTSTVGKPSKAHKPHLRTCPLTFKTAAGFSRTCVSSGKTPQNPPKPPKAADPYDSPVPPSHCHAGSKKRGRTPTLSPSQTLAHAWTVDQPFKACHLTASVSMRHLSQSCSCGLRAMALPWAIVVQVVGYSLVKCDN